MTTNETLDTTETTSEIETTSEKKEGTKLPNFETIFKVIVLVMLAFIVLHLLILDWMWWTIRDAANDFGNDLQDIKPEEIWPTEGMPEGSTS